MARLGELVDKIRSKNAGPFWLTVDIFCGSPDIYRRVVQGLSTVAVADVFQVAPQVIKRFDIASLNVIKISLPRPDVQGSRSDRDMHGASFGALLVDLELGGAEALQT